MDFNRNQFFFLGFFILLIGMQLRMVESYVLTPEATRFLAERSGATAVAAAHDTGLAQVAEQTPLAAVNRKVVRPPEWLGWCLVSIGAVLVLHSLAMPKPS